MSGYLADDDELHILDLLTILAYRWKRLIFIPLLTGAAALGVSYLIPPVFTAKTVFVPPQQSQSSAAASALASLGALANLAGGSALKTPGDQYIALLRSANVTDKMVDRFKLMEEYDAKYRFQARGELGKQTRIELGKKDGLITIEVDARSPQMAADMANQYVAELRRVSGELALTEAQQRRVFFEHELQSTRRRLADAQAQLQAGGFSAGALKAEPKAAAEGYARIKAELTAAEVKLQTLRQSRADAAPEILQQSTLVSALRSQLAQLETKTTDRQGDADYLDRYREFKYQESLYELFAKQYELARLDESKEGVSIQVVDVAALPEYKSKPKRAFLALGAFAAAFVLTFVGVLAGHAWRKSKRDPAHMARLGNLKKAWNGVRA